MHRFVVALAFWALAACSVYRGPEQDNLSFTAPLALDSAMRVAATQLQLHGYTVTRQSDNAIVTTPRVIPSELRNPPRDRPPTRWVVRVEVSTSLANEARYRVSGYVVPSAPRDGQVMTNTVPIVAADGPLFKEVEAVAGWIRDAARRAGGIAKK